MSESTARPTAGAQTLARGLSALRIVAESTDGISVQELADRLGVHRTIAYRIVTTLAEARFIARGEDGRFRGAVGLLGLRASAHESLKRVAEPILRELADELGATASLLVPEGGDAVALLVVSPRSGGYHIAFGVGSRHPLDRAAGGRAIAMAYSPREGESDELRNDRERGYAHSFGEVEPGAWGLAAPISLPDLGIYGCVNLISHREGLDETAAELVMNGTKEIEARALEFGV